MLNIQLEGGDGLCEGLCDIFWTGAVMSYCGDHFFIQVPVRAKLPRAMLFSVKLLVLDLLALLVTTLQTRVSQGNASRWLPLGFMYALPT
jgi:hypothetical protein